MSELSFHEVESKLADRFGEYAGYETAVSPQTSQTYGTNPGQELKRLLANFIKPASKILDLGCGAGQTVCDFAPQVQEAWGFDMEPALLDGARYRVKHLNLKNVTLVAGNVAVAEDGAPLPNDYFDIIYSQRGPNINHDLISKLKDGGFYLQALVGSYDGFHLREILGRRPFTHYAFRNESERMMAALGNLGLQPIQISEQFYESFFRDTDHLAAYITQVSASLSDWHVGHNARYDAERDRAALELYARFNMTADGVRFLHHRIIYVGRKSTMYYYP
ncbi:MAG: methyltransferase domain-containing protein, partial [Chloroflexi bacterium]|nr:methyltransferase domain-containing protein [Chloroflexota bacterium]